MKFSSNQVRVGYLQDGLSCNIKTSIELNEFFESIPSTTNEATHIRYEDVYDILSDNYDEVNTIYKVPHERLLKSI